MSNPDGRCGCRPTHAWHPTPGDEADAGLAGQLSGEPRPCDSRSFVPADHDTHRFLNIAQGVQSSQIAARKQNTVSTPCG